jgi:nitrite reductase/ring-hydroxylating ferredoxin subunit
LSSLSDCVKKEHFLISLKTMVLCTIEDAYFDYKDGELLAKKSDKIE